MSITLGIVRSVKRILATCLALHLWDTQQGTGGISRTMPNSITTNEPFIHAREQLAMLATPPTTSLSVRDRRAYNPGPSKTTCGPAATWISSLLRHRGLVSIVGRLAFSTAALDSSEQTTNKDERALHSSDRMRNVRKPVRRVA